MTQEERFDLLKNACEEALKQDPEVLEGKKLIFSKKSGKPWQEGIFHEYTKVPKKRFVYVYHL